MEIWILTYCLLSLNCPSLTAYTHVQTYASGYFPPLMYFRTSRLGCLLFHGDILTFLTSTSMPCITFISALPASPIKIALIPFFAMDGVTRHILSVRLIVPCRLLLLDLLEELSGANQCDRMRNELWNGISTASLNNIFLWSVNFVLLDLALLTWGMDCFAVSLSIICLISSPTTFLMKI